MDGPWRSYADLLLADARIAAKELRARVALGYDVATEKQERKAEATSKIEVKKCQLKSYQSSHSQRANFCFLIKLLFISFANWYIRYDNVQ